MFLLHFASNLSTATNLTTLETELSMVNSLTSILVFPLSRYTNAAKSGSLFNFNAVAYNLGISTDNY